MENIIKDLGNGLVIRRSSRADTEALCAFNLQIHAEDESDRKGLAAWTQDLMGGQHPTFKPDDCTIVEELSTHKIVSTMNLISQKWTYDGIPFGVGRPELVGTLPEYREQGLVRKQFEIIHQWSQERGELVQAITGIPYYYRQFGYEMALDLGGGRVGYETGVLKLGEDQTEVYTVRAAMITDIPFIHNCYQAGSQRQPISVVWDDTLWKFELVGKHSQDINGRQIYIIEDEKHQPQGYLAVPGIKWRNLVAITAYELIPGANWFKITPAVVRWLWQFGAVQAQEQDLPHQAFGFLVGADHPVYQVYGRYLPNIRSAYAWFIRVPDLASFIQTIAPALEKRLAHSIMSSYTGHCVVSFYRSGIKMVFEQGRLVTTENLDGRGIKEFQAAFPDLTFLQLLMGRRSLQDLQSIFADISVNSDETRLLLNTLFPRKSSDLWPIS